MSHRHLYALILIDENEKMNLFGPYLSIDDAEKHSHGIKKEHASIAFLNPPSVLDDIRFEVYRIKIDECLEKITFV